MRLIVTVPHHCLHESYNDVRPNDVGCDQHSIRNGRIVARTLALRAAASERFHPSTVVVPLFPSATPRFACDNNRAQCRNRTPFRQRLTDAMNRIGDQQQPFVIVDVHSFRRGNDFRLDTNPEIVLLDTHSTRFVRNAERALRMAGIDVVSHPRVVGSPVNDVQLEARQRGGDALLVEVREDLSASRVQRVGEALFEALAMLQA